MSATMGRERGRVQLEQLDMRLALNKARLVKAGFSCAAIEDTKYLIKTPLADVRVVNKLGLVIPGHKTV
jgi:hypothetical protein